MEKGFIEQPLPALLILLCSLFCLLVCSFFRPFPQLNVKIAQMFNVVVIMTIADFLSVFFRSNVQVVVFVVLFTNRAQGMLGVGPGKDLSLG